MLAPLLLLWVEVRSSKWEANVDQRGWRKRQVVKGRDHWRRMEPVISLRMTTIPSSEVIYISFLQTQWCFVVDHAYIRVVVLGGRGLGGGASGWRRAYCSFCFHLYLFLSSWHGKLSVMQVCLCQFQLGSALVGETQHIEHFPIGLVSSAAVYNKNSREL